MYLFNMAIFHSYVRFPEGISNQYPNSCWFSPHESHFFHPMKCQPVKEPACSAVTNMRSMPASPETMM